MKQPVGGENFSLKAKQDTFTAFVYPETILRPVYQRVMKETSFLRSQDVRIYTQNPGGGVSSVRLSARENRKPGCYSYSSSTDNRLPAGSLNHAIFGPWPRKIPFSSVTRSLHGRTRNARHAWPARLQLAQCCRSENSGW